MQRQSSVVVAENYTAHKAKDIYYDALYRGLLTFGLDQLESLSLYKANLTSKICEVIVLYQRCQTQCYSALLIIQL